LGEHLVLGSPLQKEECARRLQSVVDPWWKISGSGEAIGTVWSDGCRIRQRISYRNSFQTVLYARLEEEPTGTRIVCTFALALFVRLFVGFWLSAAVFMGCLWLFRSYAPLLSSWSDKIQQIHVTDFLVPFVMPAFGIALIWFGLRLARDEQQFLKQFVCDRLEAHESPPPIS
jgi:hypothetical protein